MSKIKLTESDLRSVIRTVLQEQEPALTSSDSDEAAAEEADPRYQAITEKNTPGFTTQTNLLTDALLAYGGARDVPEGGALYPSIDGMLKEITEYAGINGYGGIIQNEVDILVDPDNLATTRIALAKQLMRFELMLLLNGDMPGTRTDEYQEVGLLYMTDTLYHSSDPKLLPLVDKFSKLYYGGTPPKMVAFNTRPFYDMLKNDVFVKKITDIDDQLLKGGVWVDPSLTEATIDKGISEVKSIEKSAQSLYSQFDNDLVEAYFCMPLANPLMWADITGPDTSPLYTPWRQTWTMLNILSQAMSIPGGLESIYIKLLNVLTTGQLSSAGPRVSTDLQQVYSPNLFRMMNESRRIMVTSSELRRIIKAALMLETRVVSAAAGSAAGEVAAGVGDVAGSATTGIRAIANKSMEIAQSLAKAADGDSKIFRQEIINALRTLSRAAAVVPPVPPNLVPAFKKAVEKISLHVDDELLPPDLWQRAGLGTDPAPAEKASEVISSLLQARREGTAMQAVEKTAQALTSADRRAAALIKRVIETGDADLLTPANLERVKTLIPPGEMTAAKRIVINAILRDSAFPPVSIVKIGGVEHKITIASPTSPAPRARRRGVINVDTVFNVTVEPLGTPPRNANVLRIPGEDRSASQINALISSAADSGDKQKIINAAVAIDNASQGKLPDGTDIETTLVSVAAAENSDGVMAGALAATSDPKFATFTARQGTFEDAKGAIVTALEMIEDQVAHGDMLGSLKQKIPADIRDEVYKSYSILEKGASATSVSRYVGKAVIGLPTLYGKFPYTGWQKFWSTFDNKYVHTIVGSLIITLAFKTAQKGVYATPGDTAVFEKDHPILAQLMGIGNLVIGTKFSGWPTPLIKSLFIKIGEGSNSDDIKFLDKVVEAGSVGPENLAKMLSAYDAIITTNVSPAAFVGLTASGAGKTSGPTSEVMSSIGTGIGDALMFLTTANPNPSETIKSLDAVNDNFKYIASTLENVEVQTGGTNQFNQLESTREEATNVVMSALNERKGGIGSKSPTKVDVVSYKTVMLQQLTKEGNAQEASNFAGRFIASLLLGIKDPTKIEEATSVLSVASNPDYKKGDAFKAIYYSLTEEQQTKLKEKLKSSPDDVRILQEKFDLLAANYKRTITYTKKNISATAPPTAP